MDVTGISPMPSLATNSMALWWTATAKLHSPNCQRLQPSKRVEARHGTGATNLKKGGPRGRGTALFVLGCATTSLVSFQVSFSKERCLWYAFDFPMLAEDFSNWKTLLSVVLRAISGAAELVRFVGWSQLSWIWAASQTADVYSLPMHQFAAWLLVPVHFRRTSYFL